VLTLLLLLFAPAPLANSVDGEDLVHCRWLRQGNDLYPVRFHRSGVYEVWSDDEGVRWTGEWWVDGRVVLLRETQWRRHYDPAMGWYRSGGPYRATLELKRTNRPGVFRGWAWNRASVLAETRP
jgi:hypothetical protein